jgi:hypothetical protein
MINNCRKLIKKRGTRTLKEPEGNEERKNQKEQRKR